MVDIGSWESNWGFPRYGLPHKQMGDGTGTWQTLRQLGENRHGIFTTSDVTIRANPCDALTSPITKNHQYQLAMEFWCLHGIHLRPSFGILFCSIHQAICEKWLCLPPTSLNKIHGFIRRSSSFGSSWSLRSSQDIKVPIAYHMCARKWWWQIWGYPLKENHVDVHGYDITFKVVSLFGQIPSLASCFLFLESLRLWWLMWLLDKPLYPSNSHPGNVARTVDGLDVNYYPPLGQTKGVYPLFLPPVMGTRSTQNAGFRSLVSIHFKYCISKTKL